MGDADEMAEMEYINRLADEDNPIPSVDFFETILGTNCSISKVYRDYDGQYHVTASRRTTEARNGRRRVFYEYLEGVGETLTEAAMQTLNKCSENDNDAE